MSFSCLASISQPLGNKKCSRLAGVVYVSLGFRLCVAFMQNQPQVLLLCVIDAVEFKFVHVYEGTSVPQRLQNNFLQHGRWTTLLLCKGMKNFHFLLMQHACCSSFFFFSPILRCFIFRSAVVPLPFLTPLCGLTLTETAAVTLELSRN